MAATPGDSRDNIEPGESAIDMKKLPWVEEIGAAMLRIEKGLGASGKMAAYMEDAEGYFNNRGGVHQRDWEEYPTTYAEMKQIFDGLAYDFDEIATLDSEREDGWRDAHAEAILDRRKAEFKALIDQFLDKNGIVLTRRDIVSYRLYERERRAGS